MQYNKVTIEIGVDNDRSIDLATTDKGSLVIGIEDPQSVAIVELQHPDVVALYEYLEDFLKR